MIGIFLMMSGKAITGAIAIAALATIMGATNPKPAAYTDYAAERMIDNGENLVCEQTGYCEKDKMPTLVKQTVKNNLMRPAIGVATKRQNLGLFSIYTTEVPGMGKMQTVGMFSNFFTYAQS